MPLHEEAARPLDSAALLAAWLIENAHIDQRDLARAQAATDASGERLDRALIDLGLVSAAKIDSFVTSQLGVAEALAGDLPATPLLSDQLPPDFQARKRLLPLSVGDGTLTLGLVDPCDDFVVKAITLKTGLSVRRKRLSAALFEEHYAALHGAPLEFSGPLAPGMPEPFDARDVETLKDAASDAPVIRYVQDAINRAVEAGASDIHFRPAAGRPEMLFRIAGELRPQPPPDPQLYANCISRLKILANLDIAERRLPQDGRLRINVGGHPVDIRISTMPHVHGEAAVLRLLSRQLLASSLGDLGFSKSIEDGLRSLFASKDGLILVTGPTGSGKTTTLHVALRMMIRPGVNVVTIEDPVEYRVDGAAQVQVDEKIGLTFPRVLRSLLRQDPDVILVGEIRDGETARIAVQAALTGHLVLATLHTNSAPGAIPRLVDMGVEAYLIAAVLRGVLGQRLVRAQPTTHSTVERRLAIAELLQVDGEAVNRLSSSSSDRGETAAHLRRLGYRPLIDDAADRVAAGEIDQDELHGLTYAA